MCVCVSVCGSRLRLSVCASFTFCQDPVLSALLFLSVCLSVCLSVKAAAVQSLRAAVSFFSLHSPKHSHTHTHTHKHTHTHTRVCVGGVIFVRTPIDFRITVAK